MRSRDLVRKAPGLSWAVVIAATVSAPSTAPAKDKRTADVQVENKTGREIEFVTVAHMYSDNYKNSKTWGNLPDGRMTREFLAAEYNTGFGTTGVDWWIVTWKFKGDDTVYVTDPYNLRSVADGLEKFALSALPAVGKLVGEFVAAAVGAPPDAGGAIGGKAAEEVGKLLLNSESTVGFKKHTLRAKDSTQKKAAATVVEITSAEVKFRSPSGVSTVGFAPIKGKK